MRIAVLGGLTTSRPPAREGRMTSVANRIVGDGESPALDEGGGDERFAADHSCPNDTALMPSGPLPGGQPSDTLVGGMARCRERQAGS